LGIFQPADPNEVSANWVAADQDEWLPQSGAIGLCPILNRIRISVD
jgi:hypothetical protein